MRLHMQQIVLIVIVFYICGHSDGNVVKVHFMLQCLQSYIYWRNSGEMEDKWNCINVKIMMAIGGPTEYFLYCCLYSPLLQLIERANCKSDDMLLDDLPY